MEILRDHRSLDCKAGEYSRLKNGCCIQVEAHRAMSCFDVLNLNVDGIGADDDDDEVHLSSFADGHWELNLNEDGTGADSDGEVHLSSCVDGHWEGTSSLCSTTLEGASNRATAGAVLPQAIKRPFCNKCNKAQKLCICDRLRRVVQNKVRITILQNPKEKDHPIGSVRIALLGLENVAVVDVPEVHSGKSVRVRPKIPGSKRSISGRGGKKAPWNAGVDTASDEQLSEEAEAFRTVRLLEEIFGVSSSEDLSMLQHYNDHNANEAHNLLLTEFTKHLIPSGVALLYPSENAVELSESLSSAPANELTFNSGVELLKDRPSHLIVLDGTWPKAKRIYSENPWLQLIPHYKLPQASSPSLYEGVRRQPKLECFSTLESIVYALKLLEPETLGLDELVEVFKSMVEDQRRCKQLRCFADESSQPTNV